MYDNTKAEYYFLLQKYKNNIDDSKLALALKNVKIAPIICKNSFI
ncbi:hypothetical protein BARBAKC583_0339 [Bartonella bacilliformis KC583]|uniref:Uncharacterized protein n=1 Tax=Bartonella bacilliformis (strain ATCC 35685 / KC583 / Herrer 020/F12,63) TaxID=360095 RepID=A1URQ6_BARBK|nr:hypothetical protein BARBAKC583_0339 [Bartonella bacilliformis KC583]